MSPLGKRIIVLFMAWVLLVMVVLQVYDNVTGKSAPKNDLTANAAEPTVGPDPQVQKLADLQSCVAANPNNLQCTLDLASFYYQAGQYPQAQIEYERAALLSPNDYRILLKLAGTYIYQQKFEQAASTLQEAVAMKSDSPEIHLLFGLALSKLNPPRMNDAVAEWRKVIDLQPNSSLAEQAQQFINEAGSH
jgi:cytochrome c-type biogenesis protein CcmH/NrfG